ncbi:MAG: Peptide chain release factor 2, partial [Candidatus Levybacteria bacterium GW2011_GWC2_40_7]
MEEIKLRAQKIIVSLNPEAKRKRLEEIHKESQSPNFWKDNERASILMKEMASVQKELGKVEKINSLLKSGDLGEAENLLSELEVYAYLSGPFDRGAAIVSIHSGQGGVEAMDWTSMLFRMYCRLGERRKWTLEVFEETIGEEAGLKSVSFTVKGEFAYGYLKNEAGVHRLVRQSPFNADSLRQTSFALVEVLPEIEKDIETDIREDDLDWEFYRASSHGGQNVQKVSSAVRLIHKPTGIVTTAQTERFQEQNR